MSESAHLHVGSACSSEALLVRASALAGRSVPPRDWHWAEWIPGRTVTLMTSDGGGGKTTLALQLAVATVAEERWLGRGPRTGSVIYLSAEDDLNELHRRLDEICVSLGLELGRLHDLYLWALADQDPVLAVEGEDGQVKVTARFAELEVKVRDIKPALIVLDSLADVFGGNENVRSQARQFVGRLRQLAMMAGGAVLVLSHPSLSGISSGSGTSGSTAWSNSVRSRIYLSRPEGEPSRPTSSARRPQAKP